MPEICGFQSAFVPMGRWMASGLPPSTVRIGMVTPALVTVAAAVVLKSTCGLGVARSLALQGMA